MADEKRTREELSARVLQLNRDLREEERSKTRDQKLHSDRVRELKGQIAEALDAHDKA